MAGSLLSPFWGCNTPQEQAPSTKTVSPRTNWAGNLTYSTDNLHLPTSIEEAQEIVKKLDNVRALGSRHCFNSIADSTFHQISLEKVPQTPVIDEEAMTVTVGAATRYGEFCPMLHQRGFAIHNLASLPHISVAGACATATHGSGMSNGNLASAVQEIEFINAAGELVSYSREKEGDTFRGAVVHMGSLGLVTRVTLKIEPTFDMAQHVYMYLPFSQLEENFEAILGRGYSVSLFTDYQSDTINQVWIKQRVDEELVGEPEFYGAKLAERNVHPVLKEPAENCTDQMGVAGPWYERLPHFKMGFTPSSGKELQTEFFVPLPKALDAIRAMQQMGKQFTDMIMISEIRTIDADDLWMSPCNGQPCVTIHFTWEQDWDGLMAILPTIEQTLKPFEARPHWGKIFGIPHERLRELYPRMQDFRELMAKHDPEGKFHNGYIEKN